MSKFHTTYTKDVTVNVACEACGKNYSYPHAFQKQHSGLSNDITKLAFLAESMEKVSRRELGDCSCPHCGYIQSWMDKSYLEGGCFIGILTWLGTFAAGGLLFLCLPKEYGHEILDSMATSLGDDLAIGTVFGVPMIVGIVVGVVGRFRRKARLAQMRLRAGNPEPRIPKVDWSSG